MRFLNKIQFKTLVEARAWVRVALIYKKQVEFWACKKKKRKTLMKQEYIKLYDVSTCWLRSLVKIVSCHSHDSWSHKARVGVCYLLARAVGSTGGPRSPQSLEATCNMHCVLIRLIIITILLFPSIEDAGEISPPGARRQESRTFCIALSLS